MITLRIHVFLAASIAGTLEARLLAGGRLTIATCGCDDVMNMQWGRDAIFLATFGHMLTLQIALKSHMLTMVSLAALAWNHKYKCS